MNAQPELPQQPAYSADALFRTLDAGMHTKLTLVLISDLADDSVQAGKDEMFPFESWAKSQAFPVLLLSVTATDGQPDAFLTHLQATLGTLIPLDIAPGRPIEDRLTDLLNAILDVPADFALIIFGYHAIRSNHVHSLMSRILDYQPPQMHLYLMVSAVPPLSCLPRLRVRRQLLEAMLP